MWVRPKILTLILLVSLFSTLISGFKQKKPNIKTTGFSYQPCRDLVIDMTLLANKGRKACENQKKADYCKILGKCGIVKKMIYQKKYEGPPLSHKGDHLMRWLFDVEYPDGENFHKFVFPDISTCFNGFTSQAK